MTIKDRGPGKMPCRGRIRPAGRRLPTPAFQDLKISFYKQILAPPHFWLEPLILFALATALDPILDSGNLSC